MTEETERALDAQIVELEASFMSVLPPEVLSMQSQLDLGVTRTSTVPEVSTTAGIIASHSHPNSSNSVKPVGYGKRNKCDNRLAPKSRSSDKARLSHNARQRRRADRIRGRVHDLRLILQSAGRIGDGPAASMYAVLSEAVTYIKQLHRELRRT